MDGQGFFVINYDFFWLPWLSYGPKNTVRAVILAKKIYSSLSAYPIEGCYGYRLLCQIDEIFHPLNAELTAAVVCVVYPEQKSHPLDPGQKPKPILCCTESVE